MLYAKIPKKSKEYTDFEDSLKQIDGKIKTVQKEFGTCLKEN